MVLYGSGDKSLAVRWRAERGQGAWNMRFEGILNSLTRRYRETKSEAMREYYQRYQSDRDCPSCGGDRLRPESRAVQVAGRSIIEVVHLPVARAAEHFGALLLEGSDAISCSALAALIDRGSASCCIPA